MQNRFTVENAKSEKDAKLAQKLGQLQPFIAVFPQNAWANYIFWANLTPFLPQAIAWNLRAVWAREKQTGGSGGSLDPLGLFLNPLGLFLTPP